MTQRSPDSPWTLDLGGGDSVRCYRILRDLPGRRRTVLAEWKGEKVAAKVFAAGARARARARREWRGLIELRARGIPAPRPLHCGELPAGGHVLLAEWLEGARPLGELLMRPALEERRKWLRRLVLSLALQHQRGAVQRDFHAGNFLVGSQGEIVAIDPARIRFGSRALGRRRSLRELARGLALLSGIDAESLRDLASVYAAARGWTFTRAELECLAAAYALSKRASILHSLRRVREGKRDAVVRVRRGRFAGTFAREIADESSAVRLLAALEDVVRGDAAARDSAIPRSVEWGRWNVAIRRLEGRGPHRLRLRAHSAGALSWAGAVWLDALGIPTPRPLGFLEETCGRRDSASWMLTERVEGEPLSEWLAAAPPKTAADRQAVASRIRGIIEGLSGWRLTHARLREESFLVTPGGSVLLADTTSLRAHRSGRGLRRALRASIEAFVRCGSRDPELLAAIGGAARRDEPPRGAIAP